MINLSQLNLYLKHTFNDDDVISFLKFYKKKLGLGRAYHLFFHVTLKKNWEKIKQDGMLKPSLGKRSKEFGESTSMIYLFNTLLGSEDATGNWLGDAFEDTNPELNDDNLDDNAINLVIPIKLNNEKLDDQTKNPSSLESHYYGSIPIKNIIAIDTPF